MSEIICNYCGLVIGYEGNIKGGRGYHVPCYGFLRAQEDESIRSLANIMDNKEISLRTNPQMIRSFYKAIDLMWIVGKKNIGENK